jgi:hypothetical protein
LASHRPSDAYASGRNWDLYGEQLYEVFYELFGDEEP